MALAILSVVVFVLARATGDPLHMILPMSATPEDYANARAYLGLDRPYVEQYLSFVGRRGTGTWAVDPGPAAREGADQGTLAQLPAAGRLRHAVSLAMAFPLKVPP